MQLSAFICLFFFFFFNDPATTDIYTYCHTLSLHDALPSSSLVPGSAVLEERRRWVAAGAGTKPEQRITLTFPALESSRETAFLVAGEGKRAVLERLFGGDPELPAARLRPVGAWRFFLDRAAAPENRRSEEHTSELQSLMRISYAVFCLKKKKHEIYNKKDSKYRQAHQPT